MINLILITGHKHINKYCEDSDHYNVLLEYYYGKEVNLTEIDAVIKDIEDPITFLFMDDIGNLSLLHSILLKIAGRYTEERFDITYITKDLVSQVDFLLIAHNFGVKNVYERTAVGFLELDFILQKKLKAGSIYNRLLKIKEEESMGEVKSVTKELTEFINNDIELKGESPLAYRNTHLFYNIRNNSGLTSTVLNIGYILSEYGVYKIKEAKQLPYICILDLNLKSPALSLYGGKTFPLGVDGILDDVNHLLGLEKQGIWDKELANSIVNAISSNIQNTVYTSHVSILGLSNECYNPMRFNYLSDRHINFLIDALQGMFDILLIDVGDDYLLRPYIYRGVKDRNIHCIGVMDMRMGSLVEMKRKQKEIYGTDILVTKSLETSEYNKEVFTGHLDMFPKANKYFISSITEDIAHISDVKGELLFNLGDKEYKKNMLLFANEIWKISNLDRALERLDKGVSLEKSDYSISAQNQLTKIKTNIKNKFKNLIKEKESKITQDEDEEADEDKDEIVINHLEEGEIDE